MWRSGTQGLSPDADDGEMLITWPADWLALAVGRDFNGRGLIFHVVRATFRTRKATGLDKYQAFSSSGVRAI